MNLPFVKQTKYPKSSISMSKLQKENLKEEGESPKKSKEFSKIISKNNILHKVNFILKDDLSSSKISKNKSSQPLKVDFMEIKENIQFEYRSDQKHKNPKKLRKIPLPKFHKVSRNVDKRIKSNEYLLGFEPWSCRENNESLIDTIDDFYIP